MKIQISKNPFFTPFMNNNYVLFSATKIKIVEETINIAKIIKVSIQL